ncbi:MAG: CHAT domain-containing protein [Anaerolineae bacterium]|nr:CHAT domain-containing protein [Anaerolineae bacterium]
MANEIEIRYDNFDLHLSNYSRTDDGVERFSVTVATSPAGELEGSAVAVATEDDVRARIVALDKGMLGAAEIEAFGKKLGAWLLPGKVRDKLEASALLNAQKNKDNPAIKHRLRLRIWISDPPLASLPWEFAWVARSSNVSEGFIARDEAFSLVRYETLGKPIQSLDPISEKLRFVGVFSNPAKLPSGLQALDLQPERDTLSGRLAQSWPDMEQVIVPSDAFPKATAVMLSKVIGERAHILHYSGHGTFTMTKLAEPGMPSEGKGQLVLAKNDDSFDFFSVNDLLHTLKGSGIRLAVLNACDVGKRDATNFYSGIASALQDAEIPAVVGMQFTILNSSAIAFGEQFYKSLAETGSIDRAMLRARQAVYLHNRADESKRAHRDWGTPVLYLRAEGDRLFTSSPETSTETLPRIVWTDEKKDVLRALLKELDEFLDFQHIRDFVKGHDETQTRYWV